MDFLGHVDLSKLVNMEAEVRYISVALDVVK